MSLLSSVTNKTKLRLANKKLTVARNSDGSKADYLYETANKMFGEVAEDRKYKSTAMHNWGFSLYNQGQTKTGEATEALLTEACEKFSASMDADQQNMKSAIDWGVTLMAIAELKKADKDDPLYEQAIEKFQIADEIFPGSASYNLACIYAIRGNEDACKQALEDARDTASLPGEKEVLNDNDLYNVKESEWFKAFVPTISKPPPLRKTRKQLAEEAAAEKAAKKAAANATDDVAVEEKTDQESEK